MNVSAIGFVGENCFMLLLLILLEMVKYFADQLTKNVDLLKIKP